MEDSGCSAVEPQTWKKLERTQRLRVEGLERFAFDPKSVEKFGVIVELISIRNFTEQINSTHHPI